MVAGKRCAKRAQKFVNLTPEILIFDVGASLMQPAPFEFRQGRKAAAVEGRSGVI
jgi:hypothetical protein